MTGRGMFVTLCALAVGLAAGIAVGALVLTGDDQPSAAVSGTQTPVRTPAKTEVPDQAPAPTESAAWEPCSRPGLCDFLATLDQRLRAEDVDGVMDLIDFVPYVCGSAQTQLNEGIYPLECRDWPFADPVPTAGFAPFDRQGFPTSRWVIHHALEEFITGRESDCAGDREGIERRVRVVTDPADPKLYWNGEVNVLLGAPLDCVPTIEVDSGQRYVFNLRSNGAGQWKIQSIMEVAYDRCEDAFYRYVGDIRYYPLGEGPPQVSGPRICLNEAGG